MNFSTILIFAFVFTINVWSLIHDAKIFLNSCNNNGQADTKRITKLDRINLFVDVLLMIAMVAYLVFEFSRLGS